MRSVRTSIALAGACLAGLVLVYVLALDTSVGRRFDQAAFGTTLDAVRNPQAYDATQRLLETIDVSSLALLGGAIALVALLRQRVSLAVAAGVLVAGANLTTQGLKSLLADLDLRGWETARAADGIFPSGHATVAMSLALALVLVTSTRERPLAALVGMTYAVGVGIAVVALGWHFPSDVAGAYLVSAAWACAVTAGLSVHRRRSGDAPAPAATPPGRRRAVALAGGVAALAFVVVLVVAAERRRSLLELGGLHTTFVVAALLIAALGAFVTGSLAVLLRRAPATG